MPDVLEVQPSWALDGFGVSGEQDEYRFDDDIPWDITAWTRDHQAEDSDNLCCTAAACPRQPTHVVGTVTLSFTDAMMCSFSGQVDFDDDISDVTPDCCTSVVKGVAIDPEVCNVASLTSAVYLQYDSMLDVWNIGVVIVASTGLFVQLSNAATSMETAAGGCSTTASNPTIIGPTGNVMVALTYTSPLLPYPGTGTADLTFT